VASRFDRASRRPHEGAVKLSGNDPQRLVQLGDMRLAMQQLDHAADCADQAIAKNSRMPCAGRCGQHPPARKNDDALAAYHRSWRTASTSRRSASRREDLPSASRPNEPGDVESLSSNTLVMSQRCRALHGSVLQTWSGITKRQSDSLVRPRAESLADLLCQLPGPLQSGDASAAASSIAAPCNASRSTRQPWNCSRMHSRNQALVARFKSATPQ